MDRVTFFFTVFAVLIFGFMIFAGLAIYANEQEQKEIQAQDSINAETNFWTLVFCNRNDGTVKQTSEGLDVCYIQGRFFRANMNGYDGSIESLTEPLWEVVELVRR